MRQLLPTRQQNPRLRLRFFQEKTYQRRSIDNQIALPTIGSVSSESEVVTDTSKAKKKKELSWPLRLSFGYWLL